MGGNLNAEARVFWRATRSQRAEDVLRGLRELREMYRAEPNRERRESILRYIDALLGELIDLGGWDGVSPLDY
ncbi:MAG: hypothetical protein HYY00_04340 [Chloroflexi bacterium]|nr:hypothetical protein [Chloroflexota bacterium]